MGFQGSLDQNFGNLFFTNILHHREEPKGIIFRPRSSTFYHWFRFYKPLNSRIPGCKMLMAKYQNLNAILLKFSQEKCQHLQSFRRPTRNYFNPTFMPKGLLVKIWQEFLVCKIAFSAKIWYFWSFWIPVSGILIH